MAENQTRNPARVRDMYEGLDPRTMNERERNAHIERTLGEHPDVLFRIYQQNRLHMVMFRPSDPEEWTRVIRRRIITNMSFQLTKKRAANDIFKISMSGPQEELRDFCEDFDQLYSEVMKNLQDGGAAGGAAAATPDDDDDDVEELRERIRELELENRKLRKK